MRLTHTARRKGKLISFLREELGLSANLTQKLAKQEQIQVNQSPARLYQKLNPGDTITVLLEESLPGYPPEEGELTVLYEDEALIVLDKPAGITMHPTSARQSDTLAGRLVAYYQRTGQQCGIHFVSRLDRDTFGVVLAAKHAYIHARLSESLSQGKIIKTYHAAVYGNPSQDTGDMIQPIGRVEGDTLLRCVREDGQYAHSTYRVLKRSKLCALLELHPITGRTNQLRVHCAWAGFPILGDGQYGSSEAQTYSETLGYQTQQLCAAKLSFPHPLTGKTITVSSRQTVTLP